MINYTNLTVKEEQGQHLRLDIYISKLIFFYYLRVPLLPPPKDGGGIKQKMSRRGHPRLLKSRMTTR